MAHQCLPHLFQHPLNLIVPYFSSNTPTGRNNCSVPKPPCLCLHCCLHWNALPPCLANFYLQLSDHFLQGDFLDFLPTLVSEDPSLGSPVDACNTVPITFCVAISYWSVYLPSCTAESWGQGQCSSFLTVWCLTQCLAHPRYSKIFDK